MASLEVDFKGIEGLEMNNAILMSLLEESLIEDHESDDDEQLNRVIRSFEAEIKPKFKESNVSSSVHSKEVNGYRGEGQVDGQDCSRSQDLDFKWIDIETPSDDMSWYMDSYVDEMDGVEFGGFDGHFHGISFGVPIEEQYYTSLWQENNDVIMYN